jgi:hypothetical protein
MLSDVRVTFDGGRQEDLVKKAFPVGRYIIAGFAGSVAIGFRMIESLRAFLTPPDATSAWKPKWVAETWGPIAAEIFRSSPGRQRAGHSHILLVGVSQDEHLGVPGLLRIYVIRLTDPNYEPEIFSKPLSVFHIGRGGGVNYYTQALQGFFELDNETHKAHMAGLGAWPAMIGHTIGRVVQDNPVSGISPHVHILVCSGNAILEGNNNSTLFPGDGAEPIELKMPKIATNYPELLALCHDLGIGSDAVEGAVT